MESFCLRIAAMIYEIIYNGVVFGSFFGIALFTVDGLLKLAAKTENLEKLEYVTKKLEKLNKKKKILKNFVLEKCLKPFKKKYFFQIYQHV